MLEFWLKALNSAKTNWSRKSQCSSELSESLVSQKLEFYKRLAEKRDVCSVRQGRGRCSNIADRNMRDKILHGRPLRGYVKQKYSLSRGLRTIPPANPAVATFGGGWSVLCEAFVHEREEAGYF